MNNKEDISWIKITDEFKWIISEINTSNDNFFIVGKAGTGKSTLLKLLHSTTNKNAILLAPTGKAAMNIGGQTLHSFFYLESGVINPSDYINKYVEKAQHIDIIIIDEISMVRADILDSISNILKNTMHNSEPFGGKQIIFFGDPYQLPPVIEHNKDIQQFFSDYYESPYFFDSESFLDAHIKTIELKQVFRQEDNNFVELLNRIRSANYSDEDLLTLNRRVDNDYFENNQIIITPYKAKASSINRYELKKLDSKEEIFKAKIHGVIKDTDVPSDKNLVLKKGAKVMFLRGKKPHWVNGSLATVIGFKPGKVIVEKDYIEYEVESMKWEKYKYKYNAETAQIEKEIIGTFIQIPLTLAWAITIHKSQGATLEKVCIDFDRGAFDFGQAYVALSRTKLLTDITLFRPIHRFDIKVDNRVNEYYKSIKFYKRQIKN